LTNSAALNILDRLLGMFRLRLVASLDKVACGGTPKPPKISGKTLTGENNDSFGYALAA